MLRNEPLHHGLATESLIEALLSAPDSADVMSLPLTDGERTLLASILMKEAEELAADRLEGAVKALRRIQLRRKLERIQQELAAKRSQEPGRMQELLEEKMRLKRALMDAGLMEEGAAPPAA